MATPLSKGQLFPEQLVPELINMVRGKSSIAELCASTPIPFNGLKEFTFSMDSEIALVGESGKKPASTMSLTPRTIKPVKVVYQSRVTDEFMYASNELRISILQHFIEGYARKLAKGLDIMAFHGVNPYDGNIAAALANTYFDGTVNTTFEYLSNGSTPDDNVEDAIAAVQANYYEPSGIAMAPVFRKGLADMRTNNGDRIYPQLAWGAEQQSMNGITTKVNMTVPSYPVTVNGNTVTDMAIVGDFQSAFRWGYSLMPTLEIIEYGDPDGTGNDLKAYNQIMLRSETYLGFTVLDPSAFARIIKTATA